MALTLSQYKQQHPEAKDVPDATLANDLYQKHYADKMSREAFYDKIGFKEGQMTPGEDVLRSAGSGLVTGLHAVPGAAGDLEVLARVGNQYIDQGMTGAGNWLRGQFGYGPTEPSPTPPPPTDTLLPTTQDWQRATGWDRAKHIPQTPTGRFVGSVTEMVPGAIAMGPTGLVKSGLQAIGRQTAGPVAGQVVKEAGKNALRYGVVPGAVSEAAGQGAEALGASPGVAAGARFVGAMGAAGVGGALKGVPKRPGQTAAEMKAEASPIFQELRDTGGALIKADAFQAAVTNLRADLRNAGFDEGVHKGTAAALARLEKEAASGAPQNFADLHILQQVIDGAATPLHAKDQFLADELGRKFEQWSDNLKPVDIIAGDAREASNQLIKAKSLWNRARKSELIAEVMKNAKLTVGANYTVAGLMTAVRREFKNIAKRKDFTRRFRPDERKLIYRIVEGDTPENIIRIIGKFDPRSALLSTIGGTGLVGAAVGGIGIPAALVAGGGLIGGAISRGITNRAVKRGAADLDELVRTGVMPAPPPPSIGAPLAATYAANASRRMFNGREYTLVGDQWVLSNPQPAPPDRGPGQAAGGQQ